jgi:hypothetical protein
MVQPALALSELSREERPRVDITAAVLRSPESSRFSVRP